MSKKLLIILSISGLIILLTLTILSAQLWKATKQVNYLKTHPVIEYKDFPSKYVGEHVLSFYTHTGNRTATGVYPKAGRTVAVDTRVIPHGTLLYIEGVGYRIAEDTGSAIKNNRIDVFVDSKQEAVSKGIKKGKVYILN